MLFVFIFGHLLATALCGTYISHIEEYWPQKDLHVTKVYINTHLVVEYRVSQGQQILNHYLQLGDEESGNTFVYQIYKQVVAVSLKYTTENSVVSPQIVHVMHECRCIAGQNCTATFTNVVMDRHVTYGGYDQEKKSAVMLPSCEYWRTQTLNSDEFDQEKHNYRLEVTEDYSLSERAQHTCTVGSFFPASHALRWIHSHPDSESYKGAVIPNGDGTYHTSLVLFVPRTHPGYATCTFASPDYLHEESVVHYLALGPQSRVRKCAGYVDWAIVLALFSAFLTMIIMYHWTRHTMRRMA
ncbi:ORF36 [Ranid herpesvirus 2]|uniref:ORF36 n=1 Tax=Ranid herpesvirus 2 TaxID=389214 RepID=Q14W70_9VIRU|nr:ORF36 [Ranid herpesvirus 2]ABG25651.1 ORF36 [Ranid herpesvirus 2]